MACTPTYIEKALEKVSEDNKERLINDFSNQHLKIAREALKTDFFSPNDARDLETKQKIGNRIFAGNEGSERYSQSLRWVEEQNKIAGKEILSLVKDPNYPQYNSRYLRLNLLPLINEKLEELNEEASLYDLYTENDFTVYNLNKSGVLKFVDYANKFESTAELIEQNADFNFKRTISDFVENLKAQLIKLKDTDYYKGYSKTDLSTLVYRFENNKDNIGYIYKTYLTHGLHRIKDIENKTKELLERVKNLQQLEGESKNIELNDILKEYKDYTVYMNFFNLMEVFKTQLESLGVSFPYWSIFNRFKLEDSVEQSVVDFLADNSLQMNSEEIIDLISDAFEKTNDKSEFFKFLRSNLKEKFPDSVLNYETLESYLEENFEESTLKENGVKVQQPLNDQVLNALRVIENGKKDIVDLNKKLIMEEMVLPKVLQSYQEYASKKGFQLEALPEKDENKTPEQIKYNIPSKSYLYKIFDITDKSVSDVDRWWGSISTVSDPIIQSVVDRFRVKLLDLDTVKKQEFISLAESYKMLSDSEKETISDEISRDVIVLTDKLVQVEDKDIKDEDLIVEVKLADKTFKYKGIKAKHLVSEFAFAEYANLKSIFWDQIKKDTLSDPILQFINNNDESGLKEYISTYYPKVYYRFFDKKGFFKNEDFVRSPKEKIKSILIQNFYSENITIKEETEREEIKQKLGWNEIFTHSNLKEYQVKKLIEQNVAPNVSEVEINYYENNKSNIEYYDDLVTVGDKYLVKTIDGKYALVESKLDLKNVYSFFRYKGEFSTMNEKWRTYSKENQTKFESLNENKKLYYTKLREAFHQANKNFNGEGVKHLRFPNVSKKETDEGFLEKIKRYKNSPSELFEDIKNSIVYTESDYFGVEGVILPKFTKAIPYEDLEKDSFLNFMTYINASLDYKYKTKLDAEAFLITQKFAGDDSIGIVKRKQFLKKAGKGDEIFDATNSLKMWSNFINTNIYGKENEATTTVFGTKIDLNKVSKRAKGLINFGTLAWNFSTVLPNFAIGQINNYGYSVAQHLFTEKEWSDSMKEYFSFKSGLGIGRSVKDMLATNESDKSWIGQVFNLFGGVSGEIDLDKMSNKKFSQRFKIGEMLYFTTSAPEHAIQTTALIASLKGYKLKSGISLYDDINKEGLISFNTATQEEIADFRNVFEKIKMQLHGNYSNLDKTEWQSSWYLAFAMMYKKWIYESVRSRYGNQYYDLTLNQELEGFHKTFLKQMFRDYREIEELGLPKIQAFFKGVARVGLSTLNTLSFNKLSKLEQFKEFVYGDQDVETYLRASFEIATFISLGLIAGGLHALNDVDDEEERNIVLLNLELAASRIQKDLGFLLPYVNIPFMPEGSTGSGFFTLSDNLLRIYKDPFTIGRTSSAYTKVLAQLFENPQEQYERSGYGYEKGDYKLVDALEKTAVAPLFQISKLMNPEEQLQFMNVIYKNSQTSTSEVK